MDTNIQNQQQSSNTPPVQQTNGQDGINVSQVQPQNLPSQHNTPTTNTQGQSNNNLQTDEVTQQERRIGVNPLSVAQALQEPPQEEYQPQTPSTKEQLVVSPDIKPESVPGVQTAETLQTPEIPVEVEKYIEQVEDGKTSVPEEIVISDQNHATQTQHFAAEPVVVLPISEATMKKGKRKSPKYSLRWLSEWSKRIIKMFSGKVVYREEV